MGGAKKSKLEKSNTSGKVSTRAGVAKESAAAEKTRKSVGNSKIAHRKAVASRKNNSAVVPHGTKDKKLAQPTVDKEVSDRSVDALELGQKFAAGLSFEKLFFIFMVCSVLGSIYEDLLYYYLTWKAHGVGTWEIHRGVIYGPLNVIYGFGAALMCWILLRKPYKLWQIFVYSALIGGVIEYVVSYFQELITHTTSWDYSDMWMNFNGRTSVPIMLVWGVLGIALAKLIYPLLSWLIEKIPKKWGKPIFWVLLVFIVFDCLISWTAVIRQTLRHEGIKPFTPVGEFYDSYYTDEFLSRYYTNMVRKD